MSALDQAFIKAYAKDPPAAKTAVAASPPARSAPRGRALRATAGEVEQIYQGGALYRVEQPAARSAAVRAVPQPHVKLPPPTSPRRGVQRSILRLLASQPLELPAIEAEPPPRVARKVIIRHISHSAPAAPLGLLKSHWPAAVSSELAPEKIDDEPLMEPAPPKAPSHSTYAAPSSPPPAPPQVAPLNEAALAEALAPASQQALPAAWELREAAAGIVLVAEPAEFAAPGPESVAAVQIESLSWPQAAPAFADEHREEEATRFAGKSLESEADHEAEFRADPPHAHSPRRPHVRFAPPPAEPESQADEPIAQPLPAELPAPPVTEELTLAETSQELEIDASAEASVAALPPAQPAERLQPANPVWEVDRFQWPKTCDKLLAAEGSYLARAGEKLQAAVRDGLGVLAITGSRRGEGRTTLALCLARAAAATGVQTAIMDADFARPQLASKIGLEVAHGWQEAALGQVPLSEAAIKSLADNITALPLETSAARGRLSLADPRVTATIRAAAATFELLILDMGPIGPGEELAFPPGERCPLDAAIVVRDLRFATQAESETIGHALADAGIEAVGIAENFVVEDELPETSV